MPQEPLYPILFEPILIPKVWGGNTLKKVFNRTGDPPLGESWEISGVEGKISAVRNGSLKGQTLNQLLENYGAKLVGNRIYKEYGNTFPLLFKFIDAYKDLSVQVHPDDQLAAERHNAFGKTEMWFVIDAEEDARLILGFNREMDKATYLKHLSEASLGKILKEVPVKAGDTFFIEPGTVHAIGAGVLLAEIQQTSDITYRIYDWNRPDSDGNMRELHTEPALDAIAFNRNTAQIPYQQKNNTPVTLCSVRYFRVNKLRLTKPFKISLQQRDSFSVYMCIEGSALLSANGGEQKIEKGDTVLIPASFESLSLKTDAALFLEVYIP